jgi:tRNA dimethylallyltransferase
VLVAVVGPTASGKSTLGLEVAGRHGGEIVSCDSVAIYRGFDIGADKVPVASRRGITHHLVDVAAPTDVFNAARYAQEAATAIHDITARGRLPVLVGGSGLYYRALVRGMFPAPGRDDDLRARLVRVAGRYGSKRLHRMLSRIDPPAGRRIQPNDLRRLVRALEVYLLTGRTLTQHFDSTRSLIEHYEVRTVALRLPAEQTVSRIARRVTEQFGRGILAEVQGLLAAGVPATAAPFGALVYREVLEHLDGIRDEAATRELIALHTRQYARRQLIWFRKEPKLTWIHGAGEHPDALRAAEEAFFAPRGPW